MKKIVFIHLFNDRSGSPKVLSQVIRAAKKKYHTELLTSRHKFGFLTRSAHIRRTLFYNRSENKILTLIYYIISQTLLFLDCLRYKNKDVIFYINTMMPAGAALCGKVMGKPVIYHLHEASIKPKPLKWLLRFIIELSATKIIYVSDYLKSVEHYPNKDEITIHNALEDSSPPVKRKNGREHFNVLMACSLKFYKGIIEFFKVASLCQDQKAITFTLVLNAEEDEIGAYLNNYSIPFNVTLFSRQSSMNKFYEDADMVLNLSKPEEIVESFGLTIIEAMSYGLPVIVPPVGGPADILTHGRQGYLVSCHEIEKIAGLITQLSKDQNLYHELSNNAKIRAKDFDITIFENRINHVISITGSG